MILLLLSQASPAKAADQSVINGAVTLEWTAPGDDSLTGRASRYDLRYSLLPFTEAVFSSRTAATGLPTPSNAGSRERMTITGLTPGATYYFAVKSVDDAGNWSRLSNVVSRVASGAVDVEAEAGVAEFAPPYPNPTRGSATFAMNVPKESDVEIEAFDVAGRRVATILKGRRPAGGENLVWNLRSAEGRQLSAGIYLVRARIGDTKFVRRIVVAG